MRSTTHSHHEESVVRIDASPDELFAYLNDQERLGAHMEKPSMMMLGGRMAYEFDDDRGRVVGSVIKIRGRVLGLRLALEEVVTELEPSHLKTWQTVGVPRLFVISRYRMGFQIEPVDGASLLHVFIDYETPQDAIGRILAALFAKAYARWCVMRMSEDARNAFKPERS